SRFIGRLKPFPLVDDLPDLFYDLQLQLLPNLQLDLVSLGYYLKLFRGRNAGWPHFKRFEIKLTHFSRATKSSGHPLIQPNGTLAEISHLVHAVRNEEYCHASLMQSFQMLCALVLEAHISHGQGFVDQHDVRFEMGSNCEAQAHVHSRGVMFDWRID